MTHIFLDNADENNFLLWKKLETTELDGWF